MSARGATAVLTCALALWATAAPAVDWYQVEVIAFRHASQSDAAWQAAQVVPDYSRALRLGAAEDPADTGAQAEFIAYRSLTPTEMSLTGAYKALQRGRGYQPLLHAGWRQTADDSRAVYLSDVVPSAPGSSPGPDQHWIEGAVRLRVAGRAMRVDANFIAHEGTVPVALVDTRNLATGELHYFDHPLLGLLVQVVPVIAAGTEPASAPADAAPDAGAETPGVPVAPID